LGQQGVCDLLFDNGQRGLPASTIGRELMCRFVPAQATSVSDIEHGEFQSFDEFPVAFKTYL